MQNSNIECFNGIETYHGLPELKHTMFYQNSNATSFTRTTMFHLNSNMQCITKIQAYHVLLELKQLCLAVLLYQTLFCFFDYGTETFQTWK